MNQEGESVKIPLEFDPDTSGLDRAQAAAEKFDGTAEQLKQTLADLQKQAVATFNAIQHGVAGAGGGSSGRPISSYAELQGLGPAIANQRYASVTSTMAQIDALARQTPHRSASPASPAHRAQRPFSERMTERVLRTSSLSTLGAFAQGDFAAGGRSLARSFIETLATTQPSRGATRTLAAAVASSGAADVASGAEAGAAGGIAARLMGVLAGPVGIIGGVVAAIGGVTLGLNAVRAQVLGQEVALRANVSGTAGLNMAGFQGGVLGAGQRFAYGSGISLQTADTLGGRGVGAGQLAGGVANTLAFSRLSSMDPAQVAQLTALLMVQGQQSAAMVGRVFAILREGADRSGVSVTRLVSSLQDLEKTTGGTALGATGAAGLAAIQGMLGSAVSAGGLLGPALGATGSQALTAAGMLGISPNRLAQLQGRGDTAQMFDVMAAAAKRIGGGRTDQTTIDAVEAALQNAGVLNLAGIAPQNATRIMRTMMTQGPRAAEDERDRLLRATATANEKTLQDQAQKVADATTSAIAKLGLTADYAREALGLFGNDLTALMRATMGTPAGYNTQAGGPGEAGRTDSLNAPPGGLLVANPLTHGIDRLGTNLLGMYEKAAQGQGVPLGMLLEQGAALNNFRFGTRDPSGQISRQAASLRRFYDQNGGNWEKALQSAGMSAATARAVASAGAAEELRFSNSPPGSGSQSVNLSGTLRVENEKGNRIGTAQIAPQTVTINPSRQPRGGVKGSGPEVKTSPMSPHP